MIAQVRLRCNFRDASKRYDILFSRNMAIGRECIDTILGWINVARPLMQCSTIGETDDRFRTKIGRPEGTRGICRRILAQHARAPLVCRHIGFWGRRADHMLIILMSR